MNKLLDDIWTGEGEGSFSSATTLLKVAKEKNSNIKLKDVLKFLKKRSEYVLFTKDNKFKKYRSARHLIVTKPGRQIFLDTMHIPAINFGTHFRFVLVAVDAFSRKIGIDFIKKLNSQNALIAFKNILNQHFPDWRDSLRILTTDKGMCGELR